MITKHKTASQLLSSISIFFLLLIQGCTLGVGGTASAPVINPPGGIKYQAKSVTIATQTSGANIYYTTDGTLPSSSNGNLYMGPITVNTNTTLRAIAVKEGIAVSEVAQETYSMRILILDRENNRLVEIKDMSGTGWSTTTLSTDRPCDMALDSRQRIYIVDRWNHRIARMDDFSGAGWITWGVGILQYPIGIAIDTQDRIYISDQYNHRVVRIDDMTGAGFASYGSEGTGTGKFDYPCNIALDSLGRIYIADNWNGRIVRINDLSGAGWISYGTYGTGGTQLNGPFGLAVADDGKIYIGEAASNDYVNAWRLVRIDDMIGNGRIDLGILGNGINQFYQVQKICIGSGTRLYLCDVSNHRIVRIDSMTGTGWTTFGTSGSGSNQFNRPHSIIGP